MNKVSLNDTQVPLHYQIADYIEDMLKRGELRPDQRVPPEEELVSAFGVSRTTVRRSLEHLHDKGLLTRKQGRGTFWTDAAGKLGREKLAGINKQIFNINGKTTVRVISKTSERAAAAVCGFLEEPEDTAFVVFRRVRYADNEPMSYTVNYLPAKYGVQIEKRQLERMTMLDTLETVLKINLGTVEHEVEITRATPEIADRLGLRVREPVLTIKTSVFDAGGKPVEVVWTHFVENKYKFRVVLE